MGARKRASKEPPGVAAKPESGDSKPIPTPDDAPSEPKITPSKAPLMFKCTAIFSIPYFYLIYYHYGIESELRRSIIINAIISLLGYFVTLAMIPVASKYLVRRNLFGYDINKRGTPQGTIKVPESLGIVVGTVFLVVAILFQYFNFTADSNWLVEYNAALASICFMMMLGFVDDVLDVPWRVSSFVDGVCWAYNYCYTKASSSICWIRNSGSRYPSSVFVGDTFTYFAGMTMAVVGILGHFSETLLIFFTPQVLNFLLSLPQLAGIIPCPRHRLPKFDPQMRLLTGTNDGTLVNFFLRQFGRMSEQTLCVVLLLFQERRNLRCRLAANALAVEKEKKASHTKSRCSVPIGSEAILHQFLHPITSESCQSLCPSTFHMEGRQSGLDHPNGPQKRPGLLHSFHNLAVRSADAG
nr:UDP-N-acetylglucosamine--dolichyl-phosphate N-acetylglucosaminephosphotransferase [Ipomoea batatas]